MNIFAYTVHAELNNDGSYKVVLFDVGDDESAIETVIPRAEITINALDERNGETLNTLLIVNHE